MANTFKAAFAQIPKTATAVTVAAATVATDAPTGTVLLLTAGANGSILTRLTTIPRATVTASSLVLWISNDGGVTQRMIDSTLMAAFTVAATTAIPVTQFTTYSETTPLRLAAADRLYVGNQVALAGGVVWKAEWTDF
jgi:hypothetical protein